jgi:hypothetical protein
MTGVSIFLPLVSLLLFQEGIRPYRTTDYAFDKTFVNELSAERFAAMPDWDEEDDNPPISARTALRLARRMRDSVIEIPDGFVWDRGSLTIVRTTKHCFWLVNFKASKPRDNGKHRLSIVVLMDGTVVKPVVADKSDE